jgi:hypothetical protein
MPISQVHGALACSPFSTTSSPTQAPSGTRAMMKDSEPMITGAATSPRRTLGRCSARARFLPRMCNSPPAIAAAGTTSVMWGLPSGFLLAAIVNRN